MSTYASIGTIRYKANSNGVQALFVPDSDHYVTHNGKKYAIFFSTGENPSAKEYEMDDNGVKLSMLKLDEGTDTDPVNLAQLREAVILISAKAMAISQSRVLVQTKSHNDSGAGLKLTDIYITT